jgi:serine protease Do
MKKVLTFILLFVVGISLSGCKIDFGKPSDLNPKPTDEELPVSVEVESITKTHKLYVDETLQLKATVYPTTITEPIVFSSNNENIATVNQEGLVTGVSEGTVKITAKVTKSSTTVEGFIVLTVEKRPVALTSVSITGPDTVFVDDYTKLGLVFNPEGATANGTWTTNNQSVATIDANGNLYGVSVGTVLVTYSVNEQISATKSINVVSRGGVATELSIIVRDIIETGEEVQAYIDVTPAGSIKGEISWTSSNNSIATVDSNGKIKGIKEGTVIITAKNENNLTAAVEINVLNYKLDNLELEDNIVELARTRKDSILGVSNYKYDKDNDLVRNSLGSGFIYKIEFMLKNGTTVYDLKDIKTFNEVETYKYYMITNRHVVEGSDALKVYLHQIDDEVPATLIQYDDKVDVAIITFNYDKYIRPLELGDSDKLVAGKFAIAIGNPSGYEFSSSITFGIISHPKRFLPTDTNEDGINDWDSEYIQHDVAINPGNSGGPLLNLKGEVIGINTLKYVASNIEGMGFSIPINVVKDLIPILESGEKPNRALLGVTAIAVKDIKNNPKSEYIVPDEIEYGLYVVSVSEGSVAAKGGILVDDIITSFNGLEITNITILRAQLNQIVVGQETEIEVIVYRNGEYITLTLIF